jgi:L-ascorbate metabolism protein UlaG (beta-lactamase superfamily)
MYTNGKVKFTLIISLLILISNLGFSQTNEIKIKFIGNCGLHLTDGELNIYVDFPYKSGAFNYMEFDKAELDSIKENSIFIFTHKHPDHYSIKEMRKTLRKKKGKKYGKWNLKKLEQFCNTISDFNVKAIETEHSLSFKHYSYLITWHGKRIYFYGDTETADTALTVKNLDWAFVPYWTALEMNKNKVEMDTKMLGVYHFYPSMKTTNSNPEKVKLLVNQGDIISIPY